MVKTFDYYVKKSKEIHCDKYEYISLKNRKCKFFRNKM